jgi:hypothetical protein
VLFLLGSEVSLNAHQVVQQRLRQGTAEEEAERLRR